MKKVKLISLTLIVIMFAVFMAGCSGASDEFTTYVNESCYDILQAEIDATETLDPNGYEEEITDSLENDVIPAYKELIEKTNSLTFEEKEIEDLNKILVEYLEKKLDMYDAYLDVYTASTEAKVLSASEDMALAKEESDKLYEKFCDERDKLAKELGVELVKD